MSPLGRTAGSPPRGSPLLTGRGQFVDDVQVANPLHVAFARSPFAHAEIRSLDLSGALASPGVAARSPAPSCPA
jgi:CO/xanthine dehydrogenase Mo-binding subunit